MDHFMYLLIGALFAEDVAVSEIARPAVAPFYRLFNRHDFFAPLQGV